MSECEWWRLRADELNELARRNAVVILPVASTEQHGPHLPTQVDSLICGEIARRAARRSDRAPVVVAPTVWCGLAEHHMGFGGSFTLDLATFNALLRCLVRSILRAGFARVLMLNGHGGNTAALAALANELAAELERPVAAATYWLLAAGAFAPLLERQSNVLHACEAETSMLLALAPDLVDMARAADAVGPTSPEVAEIVGSEAVTRYRAFPTRTTHGVIGDPRAASAEKGERLLEAAADTVAALAANEAFWTLPA